MKMPGLERRGAPTAPKFAPLRAVSGQMTDDARRAIILRAIKRFLREFLPGALPPGLPIRRDIMREMRDFLEYPLCDLRGLGFFVVEITPFDLERFPGATISVSFDCLRYPYQIAPHVILFPSVLASKAETHGGIRAPWEALEPPGTRQPVLRVELPHYAHPAVLDHPRCRCAAPVPSRMTPTVFP